MMNSVRVRYSSKLNLILSLLVAFSLLLTACGQEPAASPTATTAPDAGQPTTAPEGDATTPTAAESGEGAAPTNTAAAGQSGGQTGAAGEGIMTISVAQQATWVR